MAGRARAAGHFVDSELIACQPLKRRGSKAGAQAD